MALQQSCLQELTCWCTWLFSIHKAKYSKNQQNQQNGKSCRDCNFVLISFIPWGIPLKCVLCALSKLVLHPGEGNSVHTGVSQSVGSSFFQRMMRNHSFCNGFRDRDMGLCSPRISNPTCLMDLTEFLLKNWCKPKSLSQDSPSC